MNILVVYNTCAISGKDNTDYYIKAINSILNQDFNSFRVIISGCMIPYKQKVKLWNEFGTKVSYNFVDEIHPVNVTFNHSILKYVENNGSCDSYMYMDSGSNLIGNNNLLSHMWEKMSCGKYGMITPQPCNDTEYFHGLGVGNFRGDDESAKKILFANGDYTIPIGKGMGTHINLVNSKIFNFFGRCYPDIFASHCTESIFSFLCSSIGLQWILLKDFVIDHLISLDGQSSGFSPGYWQAIGGQTYDHPYKIDSVLERLVTIEAINCGFGYEECRHILMHDESQFDENYLCINDDLKNFIKNNCFLKEDELNYDSIKHEYYN